MLFSEQENVAHKTEIAQQYSPIVFVNNPVTDPSHDVIGFNSQIETIEAAINDGATMIGVIADYGTGKSSMMELLCKKYAKPHAPKPIRINMWDSLTRTDNQGKAPTVSDLTKTFLFQLSNGNDDTFSSYVNKALSKNYSNISFAASNTFRLTLCAVVAALLFGLYLTASISDTGIIKSLPEWLSWIQYIAPYVRALKPWFLISSIAVLVWGIKNLSVAFSYWKTPEKREVEINDIFETYKAIIKKITPLGNRKRLILIEDLDRINQKDVVVDFLKELYRFQESIKKHRDRIVCIVSIRPESELVTNKPEIATHDETNKYPHTAAKEDFSLLIYPKVFDTTIFLKPIHFDDYDSILMGLIKSNPEKKDALQRLIGEEINDTLPSSFRWIKNGTNLTLRDIKDRLNHAVSIMVSLKNKSHTGNSAADFKACTAVTYLESQYPSDYYRLIKNESAFAKFIKKSHKIVNDTKLPENTSDLKKCFTDCFTDEDYCEDFQNALCSMVMEKLFNDDFRMYFYTYPKDSHIKTTEERELCNCLLFPNQCKLPDNLDECVAEAYMNGYNETIAQTMKTLDVFPSIILENGTLLDHATSISMTKAFALFLSKIIESEDSQSSLSPYWERVRYIKDDRRKRFISLCVNKIAVLSDPERIIHHRMEIITGLGKQISEFSLLFDGIDSTPQITKDEIDLVSDPLIYIPLISIQKIKPEQKDYLCMAINATQLAYYIGIGDIAISIMKHLVSIIPAEDIGSNVLTFLQVNRLTDIELFSVVCSANIPQEQLSKYINMFDPTELSKEHFVLLDQLAFDNHIKEEIVSCMLENGLFFTPILFYTKQKLLAQMDKFIGYREKIREACEKINALQPKLIPEFRKYCYFTAKETRLEDLYFNSYPLITTEEYLLFSNAADAIHHINTKVITQDT